jgi:uncharacterized caspase-like protein
MIERLADWRSAMIAVVFWISPGLAQAGLAERVAGGVVVIQATQPNGVAADCADAECSNGPVAKAIVDALQNSKITIAQLFDQVNSSVARATNGQQVPWITASDVIDVPLSGNTSHSFALVIGSGAYTHFPVLKGAPRDGKAVGKSLEGIGFQVKALIDVDGEPLAKAINDFVQSLSTGDSAFLYYSGHGFSANGAGYLPPLSGELADDDVLSRSSIAVATLIDGLARSKASRKVLILDTHYPPLSRPSAR